MKSALVGYTGFVGSNLADSYGFDALYNSKNIEEAFGTNPDLLVFAGLRAEKFIANKFPEKDRETILNAIENIKRINPKKLVLISTIDVYKNPVDVNEETIIDEDGLQPYGKNRYDLESWVRENFSDHLIVRLPGLFGKNLKKNFIFDMINIIPALLNEPKYKELTDIKPELAHYYFINSDGFYKCKDLTSGERDVLKAIFKEIGFSALNFTDSRGIFQFYDLKNLWSHIEMASWLGIKTLNMATEPVSVREVYRYVYDREFVNYITDNPPFYDFKSIYADKLGGRNGYLYCRDEVLSSIKEFMGED